MRKIVLASVALSGLFAATAIGASAAPSAALIGHPAADQALITTVDYDHHGYEWHHHEWHHRHWEHHHWHYWD